MASHTLLITVHLVAYPIRPNRQGLCMLGSFTYSLRPSSLLVPLLVSYESSGLSV
ncbi:uncharacterized protein SETTUDRAFT_161981 [Exserohilum turcica Et28A]|uniref:Uncharacterized protein n=1 Tax=Exserohilum turcicum (strain 28A) TaxID=671987 RepID=R0K7Z9_EXST2|nr:uncharacterized protein SETTUDRAFT_161981 [Exserohilum turcica Et28A]EOA84442.1 hypothetical protein SETTUDRAFT_161981 [Exserohilum turcica Et28A]